MNKVYRSVWNATTNTWAAAAETAKSRSKGSARAARRAVIALALGGASMGGAFAAEVCTMEDGRKGSLSSAGVCTPASVTGTMGTNSVGTDSIGTNAALDDAYIKVVAGATGAGNASATGTGSVAIGGGALADASGGTGLGSGSIAVGQNSNAAHSSVAIGSSSFADATAGQATASALGTTSKADGAGATALGSNTNAIGTDVLAVGSRAAASANNATAMGARTSAAADNSTAVGNRATVAAGATNSVAIGSQASIGANVTNSVALGAGSTTDRNNTVAVGSGTTQRQITNMAAGTQDTDAVNLGQMNAALLPKVDDTYIKVTGTTASTVQGTAAIAIGSSAAASGGTATAVGNGAIANGQSSAAYGSGAQATGTGATAMGRAATATGNAATALGNQASALAAGSTAIGNVASVGTGATNSYAIGNNASVAANVTNAMALGTNAVADRNDTISVGSATTQRQITNMAAGTAAADAVNVSQLEPVVTALGGGAAIDPNTGAVTGPTYNLTNGGPQYTVGDALSALDTGLTDVNNKLGTVVSNDYIKIDPTSNATAAQAATSSMAIGANAQATSTRATALGNNSTVTGQNGTAVGFGAQTAGEAGVAMGSGASAGGYHSVALGAGASAIGRESVALGVNANTNRDNAVAVGNDTQKRQIVNMAAGTAQTDAVNVSQLSPVVDALGGGATINPDGSVTGPSYTVGDGNGGTRVVHDVGTAVSNLDGRVTKNEGDITNIRNEMSSGTIGLVQQAAAGADLTVGANTDGAAVNFTGTGNVDRKLTGVANGAVTTTSHEAVNGSQLRGVSDSVASAIGAGSTVNPDGSITAPSFTVGDGNGGTRVVHDVGTAVTNLDGRVTNNETSITNIRTEMNNGSVGLVRQSAPGADLTVGAATNGAAVNFAGTAGDRRLTGVANGTLDNDAVSIAQMKAMGLWDPNANLPMAAVVYDGIDMTKVTFLGNGGTTLTNVKAGDVSATSMDAVNGSQLFALEQKYSGLDGRVGALEQGGGSGGGSGGGGDKPSFDGSGTGSTQVGTGSNASGDYSSAIGNGSTASGNNGSAIGQGSTASGDNSTAIGQGSSATGNGSVAIGQGSVADRDGTVSVGSEGAERQITNVKAGTAPTDAVNVQQMNNAVHSARQDAMGGVAAAMAVAGLPQSSMPGRTFMAIAGSTYGNEYGTAIGASYMTKDGKWIVKGAVNTSSRGEVGAVVGGGFYW